MASQDNIIRHNGSSLVASALVMDGVARLLADPVSLKVIQKQGLQHVGNFSVAEFVLANAFSQARQRKLLANYHR